MTYELLIAHLIVHIDAGGFIWLQIFLLVILLVATERTIKCFDRFKSILSDILLI